MSAQTIEASRFVRRTDLKPGEYRKNFHQIDTEIIAAITSAEADEVTPLISKIYLRLVNAPSDHWERAGVLRFEAGLRAGKQVKAWAVLCETVGVASATASKALTWMHGQGIIGYFAGKNGVGVRIFLNRASSSIGTRKASGDKKILDFTRASHVDRLGSLGEPAFNDPSGDLESLDSDLNPRAPKGGADSKQVGKTTPDPESQPMIFSPPSPTFRPEGREIEPADAPPLPGPAALDDLVTRIKSELESCVSGAAARAAAREVAETRRWFETKALPKAVRVAQAETYDLLRRLGQIDARKGQAPHAGLDVGRATTDGDAKPKAVPLTPEEITETAEMCVALCEAQGKLIDATLHEIDVGAGGWLLAEDAPKVREEAARLLRVRGGEQGA